LYPGAARHVGEEVFQNVAGALNVALKASYGKYLGPVADQALNPFSNPVEQNIEEQAVCRRVMFSRYAPLFRKVWGEPILCNGNPTAVPVSRRMRSTTGGSRWRFRPPGLRRRQLLHLQAG
jgi:hypothetical protein